MTEEEKAPTASDCDSQYKPDHDASKCGYCTSVAKAKSEKATK